MIMAKQGKRPAQREDKVPVEQLPKIRKTEKENSEESCKRCEAILPEKQIEGGLEVVCLRLDPDNPRFADHQKKILNHGNVFMIFHISIVEKIDSIKAMISHELESIEKQTKKNVKLKHDMVFDETTSTLFLQISCPSCCKVVKIVEENEAEMAFCLHMEIVVVNGREGKKSDLEKQQNKAKRQGYISDFIRNVSALRNSGGGVIIVHLLGREYGDSYIGYFDEMVAESLQRLLNPGELFTDEFSRESLIIENELFVKFHVNQSSTFSTADFKTKLSLDDRLIDPESNVISSILSKTIASDSATKKESMAQGPTKIREFLNDPNTEKKLRTDEKDINLEEGSSLQSVPDTPTDEYHEDRHLQLKSFTKSSGEITATEISNIIWNELKLGENITAFTKVTNGGTYLCGIKEYIDPEMKKYKTIKTEKEGIPLPQKHHGDLEHTLTEKIFTEMIAINKDFKEDNSYNDKVSVKVQPTENDENKCIVKIKVSQFQGLVFYDRKGPASYRYEMKAKAIRRLNLKDWCICHYKSASEGLSEKLCDQEFYRSSEPIKFGCGDPFPPKIFYLDDSLQDVLRYITKEGCLSNMFPKRLVDTLKRQNPSIVTRTEEIMLQNGGGFALFGETLVATLNLPCNLPPVGLICDVIILTKEHCPILFSFCNTSNEYIQTYNNKLSMDAKRLIRRFTKEKFTSVFCVLDKEQTDSKEGVESLLKERKQTQLRRCFQEQTLMHEKKFQDIRQALAVCIARTSIPKTDVVSDLNESFNLLTKEQLVTLTDSLDGRQSHDISHTLPGVTVCMFELTERLKKKARTVLICDTVEKRTEKNRLPNVPVFSTNDVKSEKANLSHFKNIIQVATAVQHRDLKTHLTLPKSTDQRTFIFYEEGTKPHQPLKIALIGWQNSGKSSLGNAIMRDCKFKTGLLTVTSAIETNTVIRSGRKITVTDTPSMSFVNTNTTISTVSYIADSIDSVDVVLLVVRASQLKYDQEMMLRVMRNTFNKSIFEKLAVVFTYVDKRPDSDDFLRNAPESLKAVIVKCKNRVMFYDIDYNSQSEETEKQFDRLLQITDEMREVTRCHKPSYSEETVFELFMSEYRKLSENIKPNKDIWFLVQRSQLTI